MSYQQPIILENPFKTKSKLASAAADIGAHINSQTEWQDSEDRVTASGFTESTIKEPKANEMFKEMYDQIDEMKQNLLGHVVREDEKLFKGKKVRRGRRDSGYQESGITPGDSSSVRDYNTRYMETGTVIVPEAHTETELSSFIGSKRGSNYDHVVGGYGLTAEEKLEEIREMQEIQTITGLNKIFIDDRLNFLIHLHKQLYKVLRDGQEYPSRHSFQRLNDFVRRMKSKERTPHEDLLYQVVRTTISSGKLRVKSNPFNIPVIEPGMSLNEQIIYMTFRELNNEYRTVWFNVMKDISVPEFHDSYVNKFTRMIPSTTKKKGGTILSFN